MKLNSLKKLKQNIMLKMLKDAGYEAFFVGGCVRGAVMIEQGDALPMGDIDIATNALPEQIKSVFESFRTVDTGIKHGTVTVIIDMPEAVTGKETPVNELAVKNEPVNESAAKETLRSISAEITTYRIDGEYSDNRHPDNVKFTRSLSEDLARRDFTINAVAWDTDGGLYDPFRGCEDIKNKILRAVGEPKKRFEEDALRIMRGLRFAAVLGFSVDEETERAVYGSRHLLENIAAERIYEEFKKLICGRFAGDVLRKYVDVIGIAIPELCAMKGFEQHNSYHRYDVLEHCIRAMERVGSGKELCGEKLIYMKLAALFHDVGKPETYFADEGGTGHFFGHPAKSRQMTDRILKRLKADKFTTERVGTIVKYHDLIFEKDSRLLKKWMNRFTPEVLLEILEIKRADNFATGNMTHELEEKFDDIEMMIREILDKEQCFSLKNLAVNGTDVIKAGVVAGPRVGKILDRLLDDVIEGRCENTHDALAKRIGIYAGLQ